MQPGGTDIKAESNISGYYCGACHDGKKTYDGKVIFASCAPEYKPEDKKRCDRCHFDGKPADAAQDGGAALDGMGLVPACSN